MSIKTCGAKRVEHWHLPLPHVLPGVRGQLPRTPTFSTPFGDRQGPRGKVGTSIKLRHRCNRLSERPRGEQRFPHRLIHRH